LSLQCIDNGVDLKNYLSTKATSSDLVIVGTVRVPTPDANVAHHLLDTSDREVNSDPHLGKVVHRFEIQPSRSTRIDRRRSDDMGFRDRTNKTSYVDCLYHSCDRPQCSSRAGNVGTQGKTTVFRESPRREKRKPSNRFATGPSRGLQIGNRLLSEDACRPTASAIRIGLMTVLSRPSMSALPIDQGAARKPLCPN
jgi:hypothetical protein